MLNNAQITFDVSSQLPFQFWHNSNFSARSRACLLAITWCSSASATALLIALLITCIFVVFEMLSLDILLYFRWQDGRSILTTSLCLAELQWIYQVVITVYGYMSFGWIFLKVLSMKDALGLLNYHPSVYWNSQQS